MKVVIAARHPNGGIKTYLKYVHQHMNAENLSITLVTPTTNDPHYFESAFSGTKFRHIHTPDSTRAFGLMLARVLRQSRPDLLHAHGFSAALMAAVPAKLLAIPHIATAHDVFLDAQFKGLKGKLKRAVIGQLLRLPDVINPVGKEAGMNLMATYPRLPRARVIPIRNGIDVEAFRSPHARDLKRELGLPTDALLLGFFGRFMAQKGFRLLTDAVSAFNSRATGRKAHLVCFGWGGFIREEQERLRGSDVERRIYYLDGTDDMPAALRGVDAAVIPSRWEACPLLPMEAMVAGTPIIASDCIGMREVINRTVAIRFLSGSVDELTQAIMNLAKNLVSHKERAEAFSSVAAERFDVARTARELWALYQLVSGEPTSTITA